jgi:hypothetical protein
MTCSIPFAQDESMKSRYVALAQAYCHISGFLRRGFTVPGGACMSGMQTLPGQLAAAELE